MTSCTAICQVHAHDRFRTHHLISYIISIQKHAVFREQQRQIKESSQVGKMANDKNRHDV